MMKRLLVAVVVLELMAIAAGVLWAQNTVVLRNTQYNAEGTGNVLTLTDTVLWEAMTCEGNIAYPAGWNVPLADIPNYTCVSGTNVTFGTASYPDTGGDKYLVRVWRLPATWTSTIDLQIHWRTAATTGNVVWQIQTACVANSESVDPSWNTAQTITDAAIGTTLLNNTAALTSMTTTGCAAGELLFLRVLRNGGHGSDTIAAAAELISMELTYRRAI